MFLNMEISLTYDTEIYYTIASWLKQSRINDA